MNFYGNNGYHELLSLVINKGQFRPDRTNVGTYSIFGTRIEFDLQNEFPAITTKKLAVNALIAELIWFIEGSTNERRLCEITHGTSDPSKTTIWTDNAEVQGKQLGYSSGELGPVYGHQWRHWTDSSGQVHDQLLNLVDSLRQNPYSRRHLISAWNVGDIDKMALPPCHFAAEFYVNTDGTLDCQMHQRSQDLFLGAPFNYASYGILTSMLAQVCGYKPGRLIVIAGDCHVYANHVEQVKLQLTREHFPAPKLVLNPIVRDIRDFKVSDVTFTGYQSHPAIKAPMAV